MMIGRDMLSVTSQFGYRLHDKTGIFL